MKPPKPHLLRKRRSKVVKAQFDSSIYVDCVQSDRALRPGEFTATLGGVHGTIRLYPRLNETTAIQCEWYIDECQIYPIGDGTFLMCIPPKSYREVLSGARVVLRGAPEELRAELLR